MALAMNKKNKGDIKMSKEYIDKLIEEFGEESFVSEETSKIKNKLENILNEINNYTLTAIRKIEYSDDDNHYIVQLDGGDNRNGEWSTYLYNLYHLISEFSKEFRKVWVIRIDNDCCDDVHTVFLGIRTK